MVQYFSFPCQGTLNNRWISPPHSSLSPLCPPFSVSLLTLPHIITLPTASKQQQKAETWFFHIVFAHPRNRTKSLKFGIKPVQEQSDFTVLMNYWFCWDKLSVFKGLLQLSRPFLDMTARDSGLTHNWGEYFFPFSYLPGWLLNLLSAVVMDKWLILLESSSLMIST